MANFKNSDYKKQYNFYSIMGIIGDILFYPIIIITLLCCFAVFTDKNSNKVPSILGFSMASVKSGSMMPEFAIKDIVFLIKQDTSNLRAGDIIAFYFTFDSTCDAGVNADSLTLLQSYNRTTQTVDTFNTIEYNEYRDNDRVGTRKTVEQISSTTPIYFHRIVGVYIKDDGTIFYRTQGDSTSNTNPDSLFICEDYVVGKYLYTPKFIRGTFAFVATPTGMIVTIVLPLSILTLFILFSIIEQISKIAIEKRVLARSIRYDSEESIKGNIGLEMEAPDKIWFYATAEEQDRNGVANFLWGYLKGGGIKEQKKYRQIMQTIENIKTDPKKYWLQFMMSAKNKRDKKIIETYWRDWVVEDKMKDKMNIANNSKLTKKQTTRPTPPIKLKKGNNEE